MEKKKNAFNDKSFNSQQDLDKSRNCKYKNKY